jgi:Tol biopolymer transport system component
VSTIDFRWVDPVPASEFDVSGNWEENTSDPTTGDLDSLAMLQHAGSWQPGSRTPDTETRLVDLTTGKIRRIPFRDGLCGIGCFSKDRLSVIVSGMDPTTSLMGLYQINLKTGENRRLGGAALANGITMGAALSPDGTRVVVSHKDGNESILRWRVAVVDLQTGDAKLIGEPMDAAFLSWAPDGQSIVLLRRDENGDPNKVPESTIMRMDLTGNLTSIRPGRDPVVLNDGRILFLDPSDSLWKTCTLSGEEVKTAGDGLKDYFFPAPSPDGKRLLMMHKNPSAPVPEIIDLVTGATKPLSLPSGLWSMPSWK